MTEKNPFLAGALFYAQRLRWPVFPVKPRAKQPPLVEHGSIDASTDETTIRQWWKKWPQANVAVRTGDEIFVFDVDVRHGGRETFDALEYKHGKFRDTLRQVTGRQDGSFQLIYQRPPGVLIANAEKVCGWDGIDIRGTNGYILVPPSIHPDSGKEYFWDTAKKTILEEPINPPDDWLIEAIRSAQNGHAEFQMPPEGEKIKWGSQKHVLFRLGCSMRAKGCGYDEIVEAMWTVNQNRCEKPGPRKNIEREARFIVEHYPPGKTIEDIPPGPAGEDSAPPSAGINLDAVTPSIELLNACEVFRGRFRFIAVERRGPVIVARFAGIATEAIWPTMHELINFTTSQEILAEATQTLMQTPSRRAAKTLWEPAAQLILRLAGASDMTSADSLRDEFQHIIMSTWKRAGCPHAREDEVFFAILRECQEHVRDPQSAQPARCCVWHDDHCSFVHQPSLVEWLSTPAGRNKHYDWSEVRKALSLLDFKREQIHLSHHRQTVNVRLWRGPLELLIDN